MTKRPHPLTRTKEALDAYVNDFNERGFLLYKGGAAIRPAVASFKNVRALCRQVARYEKRPFVWATYREMPRYTFTGAGARDSLYFSAEISATEYVALAALSAPIHLMGFVNVVNQDTFDITNYEGIYRHGLMMPGCYNFHGDKGRKFFWLLMEIWQRPENRALMFERVVTPKRISHPSINIGEF